MLPEWSPADLAEVAGIDLDAAIPSEHCLSSGITADNVSSLVGDVGMPIAQLERAGAYNARGSDRTSVG